MSPDAKRGDSINLQWILAVWMSFVFFCAIAAGQTGEPEGHLNRIHVGDFLEVDVIGSIEDDWRGRVDDSGYISGYQSLPRPIDVLCRTPAEVALEMVSLLRVNLRNPRVEVRIIDKRERPLVTLMGEVKTEQRFRLTREATLQELIIRSGGLGADSDGSVEIIRRSTLGCGRLPLERERDLQILTLTLDDLIGSKDGQYIDVHAGDVITVRKAPFVTVIGGVRNPQQLQLRSKMTVSGALATAGGLLRKGESGTIRIYRRSGQSVQTIQLSVRDLRRRPEVDVELMGGDIVDVPMAGRRNTVPRIAEPLVIPAQNGANLPIISLD